MFKACEGSGAPLSLTIQQESNARINRARNQRRYGQVNDERQANSRSGSMSC
jgi:hypothetical protein